MHHGGARGGSGDMTAGVDIHAIFYWRRIHTVLDFLKTFLSRLHTAVRYIQSYFPIRSIIFNYTLEMGLILRLMLVMPKLLLLHSNLFREILQE